MSEWIPTPEFEEKIRQSFDIPLIRTEFVHQLRNEISLRAKSKTSKQNRFRILKPAWIVIFVVLSILIVGTLVIGPQRAYAEFLKFFGYIPGVGFVDMDQVRVLENGVTQRYGSRELTVQRGFSNAYSTDLWLEFSDEARPIDDAWLEGSDNKRYDLQNWEYFPDESGSRGVIAHFDPLPIDIHQVTLILPEGWHIPLTWVSGREGDLIPANIISATINAIEDKYTNAPSTCSEALGVQFCIQAAMRTDSGMQILIESISQGKVTPGSSFSLSDFDVPGEMQYLTLADEDGNIYPVDEDFIQVQRDTTRILSTLNFPGAQNVQGRLTLSVPAVLVSIPLSDEIIIDLGDKPQAGQTLLINQTIDIFGHPVHFHQAVLEGNGDFSLRLKLTSDPLDDDATVRPYIIEPGRPEGIQDRYGAGSESNALSISIELLQQNGLKTGILKIPLLSASLKVKGPFTFTFDAPIDQYVPTSEPQVIDGGSFEPLPVEESLPMDTYQYSGRALLSSDLLAIELGDGQSTLYAASPDMGFAAEQVAVLPGQVLVVYPHVDRQGIDYITGEYNAESSETIYRQLYTLRFDEQSPRLLVGQFEHSAVDFNWSYDGRFLAYLVNDEQPGQEFHRNVRLIDLTCRTTGECRTFTADTGTQDLYAINWSPIDYRISLGGESLDQATGGCDIFLLTLDAETLQTRLTNLTHSSMIYDEAPAEWARNGEELLYACSTEENDVNEYALCRNDLHEGVDEVVIPSLPWNMRIIQLVSDRWLVDIIPVMQNGVYSLRTFDLQNGHTNNLVEWPANGKILTIGSSVSPDGNWVATYINEFGGLLVLGIETQQKLSVLSTEERLFLATWVQ